MTRQFLVAEETEAPGKNHHPTLNIGNFLTSPDSNMSSGYI